MNDTQGNVQNAPVYIKLTDDFAVLDLQSLLWDTDCRVRWPKFWRVPDGYVLEIIGSVAGQALVIERWENNDNTITQSGVRVHPADYESFIAQYRDPDFVR